MMHKLHIFGEGSLVTLETAVLGEEVVGRKPACRGNMNEVHRVGKAMI